MLAVISVQTSRRLTAACCKAMAVPLTRSFQKKAQGKAIIGETKGEKARAGEKKLGEAINQFISAAEAAKLQQPELSDEKKAEHEAIAKEFTRQNMRRTNRLNKDLSDKIWLSQDALRAMPGKWIDQGKGVWVWLWVWVWVWRCAWV